MFSDIKEKEPAQLIEKIKNFINNKKHAEAFECISTAMSLYPHSPVPHNLMGILLETQKRHPEAMCHFRAAYALDATYIPARYNLEAYGSMFSKKRPAYENTDCPKDNYDRKYVIKYDKKGIGRIISKKDEKYEKN